jgi:hypothetical protein
MAWPIILKFNNFSSSTNELYDRVVLIVRNPLGTFLSEFNRKYGNRGNTTDGHHAVSPIEDFQTEAWPNFVRSQFNQWHNFYTKVPQKYSKERVCVIFYEELLEDVSQGIGSNHLSKN